jgi:hypothetical protein
VQGRIVKEGIVKAPGGFAMNVTLITAIAAIAAWIALAFVAHVPSGYPHLLYAVGVTLLARRVLIGAPKFLS